MGNGPNVASLPSLYICQLPSQREFLRHAMFLFAVQALGTPDSASRFFSFERCLTRQWHAAGKLSGRVLFRPTNRLPSWAGRAYPRSQLEEDPRATGSVTACPVHVSWNSYCTPGGNVLKRSPRLKKTLSRFPWITGELPQSSCAARFRRRAPTFPQILILQSSTTLGEPGERDVFPTARPGALRDATCTHVPPRRGHIRKRQYICTRFVKKKHRVLHEVWHEGGCVS